MHSFIPSLENQINNGWKLVLDEQNLHLQNDEAPSHCARHVRESLDQRYLWKLIGRTGTLKCPVRSWDMTPWFFFWSYLKLQFTELRMRIYKSLKIRLPKNADKLIQKRFRMSVKNLKIKYYCLVNKENFLKLGLVIKFIYHFIVELLTITH